VSSDGDQFDVRGFAATISSRLNAEARIARAIGFGWLCGGCAIGFCLVALGVCLAFLGYSSMISVTPSAEVSAKALADAFRRAELKTTVSGTMSLAADSEVKLAPQQTVKLAEGASIRLDPDSTIRVVGDLKLDVPQPSKKQLQLDATSGSNELPFTRYTVFKYTKYGSGEVVTGWGFELSDPSRPTYQRCYYEEVLASGVSASQTIAINGYSRRPSALAKLSFDFDGALSNCIWFSGS
jgi:hypothetical protein